MIRVLNERSVSEGGNFCLLWLVVFSNQFDIVSETHFQGCNAVGRELWLAILCSLMSLKRSGTFASESKVKSVF